MEPEETLEQILQQQELKEQQHQFNLEDAIIYSAILERKFEN